MLKKLLLFAILSPLALQPVMKADFLTKAVDGLSYIKNGIFKPENASKTFTQRTMLTTSAISLLASFYKFELTNKSRYNKWIIEVAIPKILAVYEIYSLTRTLNSVNKNKNVIDYSLSVMKILMGLVKLPEDQHRENALKFVGLGAKKYIWNPVNS